MSGSELVLDAHVHVMDPGRFAYPWATGDLEGLAERSTPEVLERTIAGSPVSAVIAVQALQQDAETRWLLQLAAVDAGPVRGVVGWTDLTAADAATEVARLADDPRLVGFRHPAHMEADDDWLARPAVIDAVRAMGAAGVAFDLIVGRAQTEAALALVDACPGTGFVLDHALIPDIAAGEWDEWTRAMRRFAERDGVRCKLSAWHGARTIAAAMPYAQEALAVFGAERSMFGTDWPVSTALRGYPDSVAIIERLLSGASDAERRAVLSGTATRTYALTD